MSTLSRRGVAILAALAATISFSSFFPTQAQADFSDYKLGLNLEQAREEQRAHDQNMKAPPSNYPESSFSFPEAHSLVPYALPSGDQGKVGSCVTWATGYSAYGILMKQQGIPGAPMAPMFLYSQIVREYNGGRDYGTTGLRALTMLTERGITTQKDWGPSVTNYTTLPTQAQKQNALKYKLLSFRNMADYSNRNNAIRDSIAHGMPVVIGFYVKPSYRNVTPSNPHYNPSAYERRQGGHEVTIVGYDKNNVTIQNSWGTNFGNKGFYTAPWSWVASSDVIDAYSVGYVNADGSPDVKPTPNPTPSPTPSPDPTPDPTPEPGQNTITNGDFEQGAASWSGDTSVISAKNYGRNRTPYAAWMLGRGTTTEQRIGQWVTLSQSSQINFNFWLYTYTQDRSRQAVDRLLVNVYDANGKVLGTVGQYSNLNASRGYVQKSIDLSAYAGQKVYLEFAAQENASGATHFIIDDVALSVS